MMYGWKHANEPPVGLQRVTLKCNVQVLTAVGCFGAIRLPGCTGRVFAAVPFLSSPVHQEHSITYVHVRCLLLVLAASSCYGCCAQPCSCSTSSSGRQQQQQALSLWPR
jgi:hypothetical protein